MTAPALDVAEIADQAEPTTETPAAPATDEAVEWLVDDVSIDGMCGVY